MTNTAQAKRIITRAITENNGRLMAESEDGMTWRVQFANYNRLASVYDTAYSLASDLVIEGAEHTSLLIYF